MTDIMLEHSFINSAYLSELWAAQDLEEKKSYFRNLDLDIDIDTQIEDEYRHATMLKKAMNYLGYEPIEDLTYAMQNVIFKSVCDLELKNSYDDSMLFLSIHEIMERRALWNYRTYRLGGSTQYYKDVLTRIIQDEKAHIRNLTMEHSFALKVKRLDQWVHREHLATNYNKMNLIKCAEFWSDYYKNNLIKPETLPA